MATQNSITVGVNVTDNGTTKQVHKSVKDLHNELKSTQQTAKSLGSAVAGTSTGGTAGSRRALQAAYGGTQGMTGQEYGNLRGTAGATGASARDFANQAQGLGGLVRLYATLAANMFAAGAAFNALRNAMDTSNMVRGLDQLGAASGVALGTLSKQLVSVTDGAISMREAMEATVKASSSGMGSDQILRMAQVAKNASLALGVDMSDAVSRLSRGITKLEPELLDELGLFTKTGKAAEDYAKKMGKSVTELTDFERRQAFANAVLAEGEKKFGAINIAANPYTKLLANLKDLAQSALETVNKALGPVVGFLAESPTALITAITILTNLLLKQAIPALGQFKSGLEAAAEESTKALQQKAEDALALRDKLTKLELQKIEADADAKLLITEKREAEIAKARFDSITKTSAEVKKLLATTDISDITQKDYDDALARAKKQEEEAAKRAQSTNKSQQTRAKNLLEQATLTKSLVKEMQEYQRAEERLTAARLDAQNVVEREKKSWSILGLTIRAANNAHVKATKDAIVANAAYNASNVGLVGAFRLFREEVAKSNLQLGFFGKALLGTRAAVGIAIGAVATLGAAISTALNVIGLITSALAVLNMVFSDSKTGKALDAYSSSIDYLEDSSANLTRTVEALNAENRLSVSSFEAQSTAIQGLAENLTKTRSAAELARSALSDTGSWLNKSKEAIKDFFGYGIQDNFEESLGSAIIRASKDLSTGTAGKEFKKEISALLNIDENSETFAKDVREALEDIEVDSALAKKIEDLFNRTANATAVAASKAREFKDALAAVDASVKDIQNSFKVNDPLVLFANNSLTALSKLETQLNGPIEESIDNLTTMLDSLDKNPLFGPEASAYLSTYADELNRIKTELQALLQQQAALANLKPLEITDELREQIGEAQNVGSREAEALLLEYKRQYDDSISKARQAVLAGIQDLKTGAASIAEIIRSKLEQGTSENIGMLITRLQATLAEGSTKFLQSIYSQLSAKGFIGAAAEETKLKLQELALKRAEITVQQQLINALTLNTAESQKNTAQLRVDTAKKSLQTALQESKEAPGSQAKQQDVQSAITEVTSAMVDLDQATNKYKVLQRAVQDPIGALKQLNQEFAGLSSSNIKDITAFAETSTGFLAKLNSLGLEQKQIILEGQQKQIEERYTSYEKDIQARTESLELSKQELVARQSIGAISAENAVQETYNLSIRQAELDADAKGLALSKEIELTYTLINALYAEGNVEKAKEYENTARIRFEEKELNISRQKSLDISNAEVKKQQDLLRITYARQDAEQRIIDLREKGRMRAIEAERELRDVDLEIARSSGTYSERELQLMEYSNKAMSLQEETSEARKLAEKEFADYAKKLEQEIQSETDAYLIQKKEEEFNIAYEQHLRNLGYIDELAQKRKEALQQEAYNQSFLGQLQTTFADAIATAFFEGGKAGTQKLKDFLNNEFRNYVINVFINPITKEIGSALGGTAKSIIGSIGGDGGFSTFDTLSTLNTAYQAVSNSLNIASTAGQQVGKLVQPLSNLGADVAAEGVANFANGMTSTVSTESFTTAFKAGGTQMAGAIAGNVLNGFTGYNFAKMISGGYEVNKYVNKIGAAVSMIPGVGPIAGVVAGLVNRAFGRKLADMGIEGTFGGDAGFTGSTYTFQKGGWFRSDKTTTGVMDPQMQKALAGQFGVIQMSVATMAGIFEGSADIIEKSVMDFTTSFKFSTKGLDAEGINAKLTEIFTGIQRDMSKNVLASLIKEQDPEAYKKITDEIVVWIQGLVHTTDVPLRDVIADWQRVLDLEASGAPMSWQDRAGAAWVRRVGGPGQLQARLDEEVIRAYFNSNEDAATILQNVYNNIIAVNGAFDTLGLDLYKYTISMGKAADSLITSFGGTEEFNKGVGFYFENFYTEQEQLDTKTRQLTSTFEALGLNLPKTRLDYRNLVEEIDTTSEAGRTLWTTLIKLAPAFADITQTTESGVTSLTEVENSLRQVYENRKSELEDLIGTWERVSDSLTQFIKDLQQGAQSTLTPRQKFELAQREYNQAIAAIKDPATDPKERARLAEEFQGLSTTLLETGKVYLASSSGYTDLFNTVLTDSTQLAADATSLATGFKTELSALNTMAEQLGIIEKEATKSTDFLGAIDTYFRTKYGDDVTNAVYDAYLKYEGRSGFGAGTSNIDIPGFQYWAGNSDNMGTFSPQIAEQVQGLYQQLAGRTGDAEGVKFWSNMIASGTPIDAVTKAFATQVVMNEDNPTQQAKDIITGSIQTLYQQLANRTGDTEGVNYWYNRLASGTSKEDIVKSFAAAAVANEPNPTQLARDIVAGLAPATIPGFAVGTNYVPEDMLAMVHQGERIIPAADNAEILQSISNRNETNRVLVEEIKNLRREVQQLREQQSAETGSLIQATYSAQAEGAAQVSNAITQSIDKQTQTTRIKQATKLN